MAQTGNPSLNESTGSTDNNAGYLGEYFSTPSLTLDEDGLGLTIEAIRNPTNEDMTTKTITIGISYSRPSIYLIFDPAVVKPADYRMTISLHIRYGPEGAPVRGVAHTATSDSLAFTWDAYANVTEYRLVLKEAGTVIEEQTVTTESATFSGLTAATEYELDIKPLTATYNGHARRPPNGLRSSHAASAAGHHRRGAWAAAQGLAQPLRLRQAACRRAGPPRLVSLPGRPRAAL
jgi:hypothetical protein